MAQSNGISPNNTRIYELLISIAVVFWVLHIAYVFWYWGLLPEKIPVHFDLLNNPNRWGSKKTLIIIPLIHFGILALLSSISLIKPSEMRYYDYKNKDQNPKQVHLSKLMLLNLLIIISLLFFNISYTSISIALNQTVLFKQSSLVLLAAIFVCMGIYLFLIKRTKNADENL
jgi:uncharacterized membrane protein